MTVVTESNLYSHVKLYGALQCAQRQLAGLHSLEVRIHKAEKHSRALRTVTAALKTEMCTVDSTFLGEEVKQTKTRPLWGDSGRKNQHLFLWILEMKFSRTAWEARLRWPSEDKPDGAIRSVTPGGHRSSPSTFEFHKCSRRSQVTAGWGGHVGVTSTPLVPDVCQCGKHLGQTSCLGPKQTKGCRGTADERRSSSHWEPQWFYVNRKQSRRESGGCRVHKSLSLGS